MFFCFWSNGGLEIHTLFPFTEWIFSPCDLFWEDAKYTKMRTIFGQSTHQEGTGNSKNGTCMMRGGGEERPGLLRPKKNKPVGGCRNESHRTANIILYALQTRMQSISGSNSLVSAKSAALARVLLAPKRSKGNRLPSQSQLLPILMQRLIFLFCEGLVITS